MRVLRKINKGLLLTIIVVAVLVIYLTNLEKQREADKVDIKKACEDFIALTDKYVVLPEDMRTYTGEISKEKKEKIETQLKDALKKQMVDNDKAVEIQYEYLVDKLQNGYETENEVKTGNKRTITKISGYEFDGNQVTVTLRTSTETTYKYKDGFTGEEKERKDTNTNSGDEIVLQKVDGKWKIVYSYLQFDVGNNYYDTYDSDSLEMNPLAR